MSKKEIRKGIVPYLILGLLMLGIFYFFNLSNKKVNEFTYDQFVGYMNNNEIKEILVIPRSSAGVYEIKGKLNSYEENETFYFEIPYVGVYRFQS